MNRRLFVLAALALAGCATVPPAPAPAGPPVAPGPPLAELEPLYRAEGGRDGLFIRVASSGCTTKADFTFYVEEKGGAVTLAFARRRVDPCRSLAMGHVDLTFTWAELGLPPRAPVFLLNPITAWTGPGG